MHPFGGHPYHFSRFHGWSQRPPSRFVWFAIGSLTTAWWFKHHSERRELYIAHCARKGLVSGPPAEAATAEWGNAARVINSIPPAQQQQQQQPTTMVPWGYNPSPGQQQAWNESQKQWASETLALGKQASDTVTDLSEATLDSILTTVEALKGKLAQHRAQREREQKELAEQLERESKKSVRFV